MCSSCEASLSLAAASPGVQQWDFGDNTSSRATGLCRRHYFASHHHGLPNVFWVKADADLERDVAKQLGKCREFKGMM